MTQVESKNIGFVGSGRMARALATGLQRTGIVPPTNLWVYDPDPSAMNALMHDVPDANRCETNIAVAQNSSVIMLAVKPQKMSAVLDELAGATSDGHLVISIAAGIRLARIADALDTQRIIRVMPNTPCLIGQGISGFTCGSAVTESDRQTVLKILNSVGMSVEVDEKQLDAVTGLSGSGPAFIYLVIEALIEGGTSVGLSQDIARKLAVQTVWGSASMVSTTRQSPEYLREQVISPGGTTIEGLKTLEEYKVRDAFVEAVRSATSRSKELSKL